MKTEIKDFKMNPQLRELMKNYYGVTYEMSATDVDLISEYQWLCKNNELHLLFECERLAFSWNGPGDLSRI
ncbi:hypothetical protein [Bizionia sp.]|uniref:hypothetical protein n=1 Tax=Bizionia sp. TaxID=1954480 RepID=UPI003A957165